MLPINVRDKIITIASSDQNQYGVHEEMPGEDPDLGPSRKECRVLNIKKIFRYEIFDILNYN